jgi:putative ABC transport system permease protein
VDSLRADLRSACRTLLHRPLFSATAVLTLAIGIGVNTVAFSAINGLLGKPRRFPDADTLGWINVREPGNAYGAMSLPDFEDFRRANRAFETLSAEGRMALSLRIDGGSEQVWTLLVSSDYLAMLRAKPKLGRIFTGSDLADLPAIVSERFWTDRLGGGDSVAGRTLTLNGRTFSIVGVLPDGFQGPGGLFEPAVWLPLERIDVLTLAPALRTRGAAWLGVTGRLRDGVGYPQAEADLQSIARRLAAEYPVTNKERSIAFLPVIHGNPEVRSLAPYAWIALGVVGIVLLIACFNVAGLLLARAAERQREISIRAALGASRGRILRQLVVEGIVLAVLSGTAAVLLANWSGDLLSAFSLPAPIPQRLHMGVGWPVVGFTAMLAAIAGVLPAVIPALHATRANLLATLKMESSMSGRPSRARNVFVVAQVAGSTLFLAAALLFVRSFWNAASFDPGFDVAHTLTVEVNPATYGYDGVRSRAFAEAAVDRVAALPGVRHAALADRVPFFVGFPRSTSVPAGGEDCAVVTCRTAFEYGVGRGHFAALGTPFVAGRDFTEAEIRSGAGAIVNAAMAAQLWPHANPVGQWVRVGKTAEARQVIGVTADIVYHSKSGASAWHVYRPMLTDEFAGRLTIAIRTAGDPRPLVPLVRQQVQALDANVPPYIRTMPQRMEIPLWPARTAAGFLSVCGTLALVLASVGLFGVTYYAVSQRTREFGVRVALGATPRRVMSLVLREGLVLTIPGVVLGSAAALVAARIVSSLLSGVSPSDPLTYVTTAVLQTVVALAACAVPALRATRVDPIVALRQE